MQYPVIVRSEGAGRYVARPLGVPEIEASAPTEAEAIEQVRRKLSRWLRSAKLVQVEVPARTTNPWLESFGRSGDDPDFEEFQRELQRIRSTHSAE